MEGRAVKPHRRREKFVGCEQTRGKLGVGEIGGGEGEEK